MGRSSAAQLVTFAEPEPREATSAAPVGPAPVELPRARRPGWPTLASLAIATGLVALGLGAWAIVSGTDDGAPSRLEQPRLDRALSLLASPDAERIPLRGSVGHIVLVASPGGAALLALSGLGPAPEGYDYEAWVVPPGSATPSPAGTFDGSERIVPLSRAAPPGARVGVTLEADGGTDHPTRPLRLVAERAP